MREPTSHECSHNSPVFDDGQRVGYAIWYPQMGGYVGKAVAVMDKGWKERGNAREGGCIDVYVWHDGQFPFSADGVDPYVLHHCDPVQFIEFGEKLADLNDALKADGNA